MIEINLHSSIKITTDKIFYFDPYKIENDVHDADYIFITHDHYDHFDTDSINKILKSDTLIVVPSYLKDKMTFTNNYILVEPNKKYNIDNISFDTLPSYNIDKKFHKKEYGNVGYNILIDDKYYFIPGDCDALDEISNIKTDICFIPIGGTYTMDYVEASELVNKINPQKVIPIHYGSIVGDVSLGCKFKDLINENIEVELMIKER